MANIVQRLIALGSDSQLTADFQSLCGIRKVLKTYTDGSTHDSSTDGSTTIGGHIGSHTTNGVINSSDLQNGCLLQNGLESSEKVLNGHVESLNGLKLRQNTKEGDDACINNINNGLSNGYQHTHLNKHGLTDGYVGEQKQSNDVHPSEHVDGLHTENSQNYTIENYFFYYLFSFGASLGNDVFYIVFFSFALWNFDAFVMRKVLICWCVVMYIGQAAKDVIRWPRPSVPPVIRMEQRYELEYGMPSTHAMVGTAIPFGLLIFMSGRYEFNFVFMLLFATSWSAIVSLSRLYLGMHSVLDIVVGIAFTFLIFYTSFLFVDPIDTFLISHPLSLPVMVTTCVSLCLVYPTQDKWNSARADTTNVLSVFSGIYAGLWLTGKLTDFTPEPDSPPFVLGLPSLNEVWLCFLRQLIGVIMLVVILTAVKKMTLRILAWMFGLDHRDPEIKKIFAVELPYRYVSYFSLSTIACYCLPVLFHKLNIGRPGFYSEVFNY